MPRKPKGDKPMTSTERSKAHRSKAKPTLGKRLIQSAHEGTAIAASPMDVLQAAWNAADKATRDEFLDTVCGWIDDSPPPPPRGVDRTKPLWRNMAAPGSLLKGAK